MTEPTEDLREYLLGTLPEPAAERIELRLLADEAFFREVLQAEEDLLDELAVGTLAEADAGRLRERLANQRDLQERLRLRRALVRAIGAGEPSRPRWWTTWLPAAVTACLVLALAWTAARTPPSTVFFPAFAARGTVALPVLQVAPPRPVGLQFQTPGPGVFDLALRNQSGSVSLRLFGARTTEVSGIDYVTVWLDTSTLAPGRYTVQLIPKGSAPTPAPATWSIQVN